MYPQDFLTLKHAALDIFSNQKKDIQYAELVIYFLRKTIVQLSRQRANQQAISNAINLQYQLAIYQNYIIETTLSKDERRFDELDLLAIDADVLNQRMLKTSHYLTVLGESDNRIERKVSDKKALNIENSDILDARLIRPAKQKTFLLASRLGIEFGSD